MNRIRKQIFFVQYNDIAKLWRPVHDRAGLLFIEWRKKVKGAMSLSRALLKIEIRHFDGPVFPYTLRASCQYTSL